MNEFFFNILTSTPYIVTYVTLYSRCWLNFYKLCRNKYSTNTKRCTIKNNHSFLTAQCTFWFVIHKVYFFCSRVIKKIHPKMSIVNKELIGRGVEGEREQLNEPLGRWILKILLDNYKTHKDMTWMVVCISYLLNSQFWFLRILFLFF